MLIHTEDSSREKVTIDMLKEAYPELIGTKKNIVLVGESGCGKSEIALNLATAFAEADQKVDLFDLDQTKPLYRSRDLKDAMEGSLIQIHCAEQMLDTPVIVGGVRQSLLSDEVITILDIGGFDIGSKMIGRFSDLLNTPKTKVLFVLNPYRPWSKDSRSIMETMNNIRKATKLNGFTCIANPHLGPGTTAEDFMTGLQMIKEKIPKGMTPGGACVRKDLLAEVGEVDIPLIPIDMMLEYEWNQ